MSEQIEVGSEGTEVGQPSQELQQQPPTETPAFVTRADLEEFGKSIADQVRRATQSQVEHTLAGFKKRLDKETNQFASLAAEAGFSKEDIEAAVQQRKREALAQFQLEQQEPEQSGPDPQTVEQVNRWIIKQAVALGVEPLEPTDPEFKGVNFNEPNPDRFKQQYQAAMGKKATREGKQQPAPEQPPAPQANPAARMPNLGAGPAGGGRVQDLTSRLDALLKDPKANAAEVSKVQNELASLLR